MNPVPHVCPTCHQPIRRRLRDGHTPLTDRQRLIFDHIRDPILQGQPCPSIREIGKAFGIRSTHGVTDHLEAIVRKGWLVAPERFHSRSYTLPFEDVSP